MGVAAHILDHTSEGLARLLEEYRDSPQFHTLLSLSFARDQTLEDIFWQLQSFVLRNIDAATGHLLAIFGKIVGEPRGNAATEAEYRLRIRARVRANRSSGLPEHIYSVFAALLGAGTSGVLRYEWSGPAAFFLHLTEFSLDQALVPVFSDFLYDSKSGGARAILESYEGNEDQTLRFGTCAHLSAAHLAGVTTLDVYSTADFPASGSLIIDEGTATEETRAYTGKTATSFTGVTATGQAHAERAICGLTTSPGLGMADHAVPGSGGIAARWTGV